MHKHMYNTIATTKRKYVRATNNKTNMKATTNMDTHAYTRNMADTTVHNTVTHKTDNTNKNEDANNNSTAETLKRRLILTLRLCKSQY